MSMRLRIAVVFFFLLVTDCYCQKPASNRNYAVEAQLLNKAIQSNHFRPRIVDDTFSQWVYGAFLEKLDVDHVIFTEEDFNSIIPYKFKIDDDINANRWQFLPAVSALYERCLTRADKISSALLQSPFVFSDKGSHPFKEGWAANDAALKERWRYYLEYEMLARLTEIKRVTPAMDDKKFLAAYEPEARERVKASTKKLIGRALNHAEGYSNFVGTQFLETLATAFDPHSNYLPPTQIENFMGALSSEGYYFGFSFKENLKGDIQVEGLAPGSPAWKSGALNAGDVVRQVKWDGKEAVDLHGLDMAEFDDVLLESNHSSIELTVEKATGQLETVVLRKERMATQQSVVKSFILKGKKKIGYINLPGFYSNWGEPEGAACANDVASEIVKLKAEGIDGLILDIRFNGGGLVKEAVAMAGIFIDAGPIGLIQDRSNEVVTLKDMNRGTIYDGPLIVLVNKLSASASEILAAALQDHNRAIIVGTQTFGKATAQNLFPLEKTAVTDILKNAKSGIGYASITIQKVFRITGKTAQLTGVKPHVILPDLYDSLEISEASMPLALPSDSIVKKTYYQPGRPFPVEYLRSNSQARVSHNDNFSKIIRASSLVNSLQGDGQLVPLNWKAFREQSVELQNLLNDLQTTETNSFVVDHHSFDKQHMKLDEYVDQFNSMWVKKLRQDVSLEEAFHIICDYIDINNKK